jgi:hypothetical protein
MSQIQTYNCLYVHQKETIPRKVLWNPEKWMQTPSRNDQEWIGLAIGL